MTFQEKCKEEFKELREAFEEYRYWGNKASLPPSITPIEEGDTIHNLSDEEIRELAVCLRRAAWQKGRVDIGCKENAY